ncbi:hypothetical protein GCM10009733_105970 [Nonomuraea maheshkhaliensis]|uniref:Uncharacterized protein n=1 Tax=Nonomuraea maheshkhaliensis TaxID=419590 RepID=A0ABN2HTB2_9ACTN
MARSACLTRPAPAPPPARPAGVHACHRHLRIERTWSRIQAFVPARQRLTNLPALT